MAASKTGGSRKTATKKQASKKADQKQATPRVKKVMAWNTKDIREQGGSVVLISADKGKSFTNIGQFAGVGLELEKNIAEALKVPHSGLAEKLGDSVVLAVTTRYVYKSTGADRKAATSE